MRVDRGDLDVEHLLDRDLDLGLVGVRAHQEGVLVRVEEAVALLATPPARSGCRGGPCAGCSLVVLLGLGLGGLLSLGGLLGLGGLVRLGGLLGLGLGLGGLLGLGRLVGLGACVLRGGLFALLGLAGASSTSAASAGSGTERPCPSAAPARGAATNAS